MASVGGLSSSTSSSLNSIRGYGGLASGLDRDTLIEQMTAATQSKIDAKNQQKTKLEWEQEAIRSITDKMYDFSQSYTSYSSSTNLLGTSLYNRTVLTASGTNAKYVSVTGSAKTGALPSILGVKQLAQKAMAKSSGSVSDRKVSTNMMGAASAESGKKLSDVKVNFNMAGGESIYVKYGTQSYTVKLGRGEGYSYNTAEDVVESIEKSLKEVSIGEGKTLADVLKVSSSGDRLILENQDAAGNDIEITGGSGNVLNTLGFLKDGQTIGSMDKDWRVLNKGEKLTAQADQKAMQEKSYAEIMGGQEIAFSYNGKTSWIEMPDAQKMQDMTFEDVRKDLQDKLDDAFGTGRIEVAFDNGNFGFKTMRPGENKEDLTSTLSISASTGHITGEESLFGIADGESNRLNLSAKLDAAGTAGTWTAPSDGKYTFQINGKDITLTKDMTVQQAIDEINNSGAKVQIAYQENEDRFVMTSTEDGASGKVEIVDKTGIMAGLFGIGDGTNAVGKDAIITVQYAGSDEAVNVVRGSNTLSIDGLNITVNSTFGEYIGDTITDASKADKVTLTGKADTDKAVDAVKGMIEKFNEILKQINDEASTKPNRDYKPLTSSQKADLSEKEIELWEKKAKEGLLFNDSDIKGLANGLRNVISPEFRAALSEIGITTSDDYADNGKLVFDEAKFRTAMETDPEKVRKLLTEEVKTDSAGNKTGGGLMANIKTVMDKYASMTGSVKGILVQRAGSTHSLTSVLTNTIQKQLDDIDKQISSLTDRLTMEQDRFISQFTQLETLISQMNSQSSYLAGLMGQ